MSAVYDQKKIDALASELMEPQRLADGGPPDVPPRSRMAKAAAAVQAARSIGDEPLEGAPTRANVPNVGEVRLGKNREAEEAARRASAMSGVPYRPTTRFAPLDVDRATRIAREYDLMKHDPDDPLVKLAYEQMIKETNDQYEAMLQAGIEPYFIEPGSNTYRNSPYEVLLDVAENRRLGVFPSVEGFGTDPNFNPQGNPLLQETGRLISGRPALANDLFRAVHDYFGHAKPGVGFRAAGEENAYQSHAGMFSPLARRALASETRGQNSYLNYGPYGETNRTARIEDTRFADQKAGLMPRWASEAGLVINDDRRREFFDNLARNQTGLEGAISDDGKLRLVHYSSRPLERIDPAFYGRGLSRASLAERNRSYDPEFVKRSYYGIPASEKPYVPEFGLGGIRNEVLIEPELIYQAQANPEGLWLRNDPTGSERRIAEAGYTGYYTTDPKLGKVAVIFDPYDVSKSYMIPVGAVGAGAMAMSGEDELETMAGGGAIRKAADAIRQAADNDLDMSTEARMQRAAEQGYTDRLTHSSSEVFAGSPQAEEALGYGIPIQTEFKKTFGGTYFAPEGSLSEDIFSKSPFGGSAEYLLNKGNNFNANYRNMSEAQKKELTEIIGSVVDADDIDNAFDVFTDGDFYQTYGRKAQDDLMNAFFKRGYDSVTFPDNLAMGDLTQSTVIFDPSNIRSVNAAFDPAKRESSNILSGLGAAAIGVGALTSEDDPEGMSKGGLVNKLRSAASSVKEAGNVYKAAVGNMFSPFEPTEPQLGDPNDYEFPELRLRRPGIVNLAIGMPNMFADMRDLFGSVKDAAIGDEVPDEQWRRFDTATEAQGRYEDDMDAFLRSYTGKGVDELSVPMSAVLGVSEALAQPGIVPAKLVAGLPRAARYLSNLAEFATPVTVASPGAMTTGAVFNAGIRALPALTDGDDLEQMNARYSGRELSGEEQAELDDYLQELLGKNYEMAEPQRLAGGGAIRKAAEAIRGAAKSAGEALDMSAEARRLRAAQQGFNVDEVLYHGTDKSFENFIPKRGLSGTASYLTPNADIASAYAMGDVRGKRRGEGANILPAYVRGNILSQQDLTRGQEIDIWKAIEDYELANAEPGTLKYEMLTDKKFPSMSESLLETTDEEYVPDFVQMMEKLAEIKRTEDILGGLGYTGVRGLEELINARNRPGLREYESIAVFDPKNIRSVNARFNPRDIDSSNILSGLGAAAVGAGALTNEDDPDGMSKGGLVYDADAINALANELMEPVRLAGGGPPPRSRIAKAAATFREATTPPREVPDELSVSDEEMMRIARDLGVDVDETDVLTDMPIPSMARYTAADRAAAGRRAASLIRSQHPIKASEALGRLMEQGFRRTSTTQADRTRVGGGNIGGPSFPVLGMVDPEYAGRSWGVMNQGTASRLMNLSSPETAWTTMLGSSDQLKSNPIVFDKLKRAFLSSMRQGNLTPELESKINQNLRLIFGEDANIRDPNIWDEANTFDKRGALAELLMGQGIEPKKGGVALGGEKSGRGVIFKPSEILMAETERGLLHPAHGGNVPTFALGPRLFTIGKTAEYRPDLHPGFPTLLEGRDLGYNVMPTPTEVYLPDWHRRYKSLFPERKPGSYELRSGLPSEGLPSQELTDEYIRHLIREGFSQGGLANYRDMIRSN